LWRKQSRRGGATAEPEASCSQDCKKQQLALESVLVRLDHVASFIVDADHGVMRTAEKLGVADCIADCVWLAVPQATVWQRIANNLRCRRGIKKGVAQ
jgi:hypothetical protein